MSNPTYRLLVPKTSSSCLKQISCIFSFRVKMANRPTGSLPEVVDSPSMDIFHQQNITDVISEIL